MLSLQTFKKMDRLSHLLERAEIKEIISSPKEEEAFDEFAEYLRDNYSLVKVNDSGINNYHFELQKVR